MIDTSLKGKIVLITGGAGYFGTYFMEGLLEAGAQRLINIEYPAKGKQLLKKLQKKFGGKRIAWYEVDLYDHAATDQLFSKILKEHKRIDVLVNNAFDFSPRTGFEKNNFNVFENSSYEQFVRAFESGAYWAIQATQKFGLLMKKRGGGAIINICSEYAIRAPSPRLYEGSEHAPNPPGYGVAKAGLLSYTRYAASWLAPVRVNALIPGAFPNLKEGHERAGKSYKGDFLQRLERVTMLNRTGHPRELVGPLLFLASDASSYVTGHGLPVDGGWSMI